MAKTCLVTGGTGFIGRALIPKLLALGYSVTVLSRRPLASFCADVQVVQGDLLNPASLPKDIFCGINNVFHLAGELSTPHDMHCLHVDGTAALLDLVSYGSTPYLPIRWVQLSSVGAYGPALQPGKERIVFEGSDLNPRGEYEITKTKADMLVLKAFFSGRIALTILRPANVFGPGMTNRSLFSLLAAVRSGLFFYIGKRNIICNYVHVDDVARALIACAEPVAEGKTYNLSNDCYLFELIDCAAIACGKRRPWLVVPVFLVRILAVVFDRFSFWPLTQSRIDALVSQTKYPSDSIRRELGFKFSCSVPKSIMELSHEF